MFWLDIERMVSLKGMIIRCSSIIPEIREALFRCLVCGYYSDPVVINRGKWIGYVLFIGLIVDIGLVIRVSLFFVDYLSAIRTNY